MSGLICGCSIRVNPAPVLLHSIFPSFPEDLHFHEGALPHLRKSPGSTNISTEKLEKFPGTYAL